MPRDGSSRDEWASWAERLHWFRGWDEVLEDAPPRSQRPGWARRRWFVGGQLNASYNCVDRHLDDRRNQAALIWEGEPEDERRTYTYWDLHREVGRFATVLRALGVEVGDPVAIYMPAVPEQVIALLACARIGAPYLMVSVGHGPAVLAERLDAVGARVLITADGAYRGGTVLPVKAAVDRALNDATVVEQCVVVGRGFGLSRVSGVHMTRGRDQWYHERMDGVGAMCPAAHLDSEHPLCVLHTAGTTGKPAAVSHGTGGYLTQVHATTRLALDLRGEDVHWCLADASSAMGLAHGVLGPLTVGATTLMVEGQTDWPDPGRMGRVCERHGVSVLTVPAHEVHAQVRRDDAWPSRCDLTRLRRLTTVGGPIAPAGWSWLHRTVGEERRPVVQTWGQTETGTLVLGPLPDAEPASPESVGRAFPGVQVRILDEAGGEANEGHLALACPWPATPLHGPLEGLLDGTYRTGDAVRTDDRGDLRVTGRIDDVIRVGAHRVGALEVERVLGGHEAVIEAAVVGAPGGERTASITAFVVLRTGRVGDDSLRAELAERVAAGVGPWCRVHRIVFAPELPRTISGTVVRRLLGALVSGDPPGDTTTLADPNVLLDLKRRYDEHR